jgi:CHAT domain-containing protein
MSQHDDNLAKASNEALLRFLDKVPSEGWHTRSVRSPEGGSASVCPSAASYMRLVLGTVEKSEAGILLEHASGCEACGSLFAASLRAMEGTPSPEEAAAIAELAAASQPWQSKLARELAATKARKQPAPGGAGFGVHGKFWLAAGVAAVLAAAVVVVVWQRHVSAPEHLLAMAYQQSRTLELRIPDAAYAAIVAGSRTRGAAADSEPAPLLEARAGLARQLQRSPQDAHWLQLQARADVLEERYDSATDVLDRLLAAGPVTADLLTDAAAAYYQRGLVSGRELDRSTALDYLRRADELAPTDPVILFNEAIVMEDRGQMMNAVEVWNRYITVERDAQWAAEGKRKLTALEQTLNRLKSHESRVRQMLATPEAMDALAGDAARLATFDEELSSMQLDKLLVVAYPVPPRAGPGEAEQARGSPCTPQCLATRRLLKAIATSLQLQHHDFWLSDLLSPNLDSLPSAAQIQYTQALQLLARATREDMTGTPADGARMVSQALKLFQQLKENARSDASLQAAALAGTIRAEVEYLTALQRQIDFRGCRSFAQQMHARQEFSRHGARYPWIETVSLSVEQVCDDTPETRLAGRKLGSAAEQLAMAANYRLLIARVRTRFAGIAQNAGDDEACERQALAIFHELVSADPPSLRIISIISTIALEEQDSPRAHMSELSLRETATWAEAAGFNPAAEVALRMQLADAEMRIGAMAEAENQLHKAYAVDTSQRRDKSDGGGFAVTETSLARSMLERGDVAEAARFLNLASAWMAGNSDTWQLRRYAATLGQLQLAQKEYGQAAHTLESDIRISEGKDVHGGDRATAAEYAGQDHDLYAELAATWLAQGRPAASVLALWERFRMRSRGLPIPACPGQTLDCAQASLLAEQHRLGSSLLVGQIVLLDRVLIYRVDNNSITWSEKQLRRQDMLDAAQTLERAVGSPFTSTATAEQLGARLRDSLLPPLPANLGSDAALLLEPDPMLQNLSWAVLPASPEPLGLHYPLAEISSLLVKPPLTEEDRARPASAYKEHALVIGASVAAEGEPPLPEALKEAQAVNGFLHTPELFVGEQATSARVAQSMATATFFHFAGHALLSRDGTELMLAAASPSDQKPWIDGAFLRQHPPRVCRLAVLSACATGQREASWNHPLQDIVETLGSLGVPEIVATRWQINSEAAVPFIDSFYQNLRQGNSVAWALTAARRVQSRQPLYSNPYYWGAYYVTGRESMRLAEDLHARLKE